jgi:DNA-binding NarL/FixJ family response regulator
MRRRRADERPVKRTAIAIGDPVALFRSGLRATLEATGEFAVVEGASMADLVRVAEHATVELALVDRDLPPWGAVPALERLAELGVPAVVWASAPTRADVFAAFRAGARGYLYKDISAVGLVQALRGFFAGEAPLSRGLATLAIEALHDLGVRVGATERLRTLSPREREVLQLIAQGLTNRGIASLLVLSSATVKRHVRNVLAKLEVSSRREAAALARLALEEDELQELSPALVGTPRARDGGARGTAIAVSRNGQD